MIAPWRRGRMRLGVHMGWPSSAREQAIGWAMLQIGPRASSIRDEGAETGDPHALALDRARKAVASGASAVDLYGYADEAGFALSRAAEDGMSREDHCLAIARLLADLRAEGIPATIQWLDADGYTMQQGDADFTVPDFLVRK